MDCKLRAKNCGGCPLLGLDYAAQLKQKEEKVRALVGKYGPVHPIRGMEQPYHYRNKVISTFAPGWGGKPVSYTHLDVYKRQARRSSYRLRRWCRSAR